MYYIFVLLLLFGAAVACNVDKDCGPCHLCDTAESVCKQVPQFTDPNTDCGESLICGVRSVCGPLAHCVLESKPECICNYSTGTCLGAEMKELEEEPKESHNKKSFNDLGVFFMSISCMAMFGMMIYLSFYIYTKNSPATTTTTTTANKEEEEKEIGMQDPPFTRINFFQTRRTQQ